MHPCLLPCLENYGCGLGLRVAEVGEDVSLVDGDAGSHEGTVYLRLTIVNATATVLSTLILLAVCCILYTLLLLLLIILSIKLSCYEQTYRTPDSSGL